MTHKIIRKGILLCLSSFLLFSSCQFSFSKNVNIADSIAELDKVPLPFGFDEWIKWYKTFDHERDGSFTIYGQDYEEFFKSIDVSPSYRPHEYPNIFVILENNRPDFHSFVLCSGYSYQSEMTLLNVDNEGNILSELPLTRQDSSGYIKGFDITPEGKITLYEGKSKYGMPYYIVTDKKATETYHLENDGSITKSEETTDYSQSNRFDKLREYFLEHDRRSINPVGYLGLGTANPKEFSFELFLDTLNNTRITVENIEAQDYIIPFIYKPGYSLFHLIVRREMGDYYQVFLNVETLGYVRKDQFDFYSWPDFLKSTVCVNAKTTYTDKDDPATGSEWEEEGISLKVEQVDGDWLMGREQFDPGDPLGEVEYWVKWKSEDRLLVRPIFLW